MKNKVLIPIAAMEKLLKDAGADRVSENAKEMLYKVLIDKAEIISKKAIMLAHHTGRQTIKAKDIKLAVKN